MNIEADVRTRTWMGHEALILYLSTSITRFTTIMSFRFDTVGKSHISLLVAVVVGLVLADTSPSSLESPGQKSRHEVHFLVKHYGRDGRKKRTREGVASRG